MRWYALAALVAEDFSVSFAFRSQIWKPQNQTRDGPRRRALDSSKISAYYGTELSHRQYSVCRVLEAIHSTAVQSYDKTVPRSRPLETAIVVIGKIGFLSPIGAVGGAIKSVDVT